MTPAPPRAPRPATSIVVAGYGALTFGVLTHPILDFDAMARGVPVTPGAESR